MKFLAIDTSGAHLSVVAYVDGKTETAYIPNCAMKHSIVLMDEIDDICRRAHILPRECDFFGVVVGPGSFTGIRIGISTVKGLCLACGKPAVAVTSLDCLAYAEGRKSLLSLVDAGHGYFYACPYDSNKKPVAEPRYLSGAETEEWIEKGYAPLACEELFEGCGKAEDLCGGLTGAVLAQTPVPATELAAVYLRKSSAEEQRK